MAKSGETFEKLAKHMLRWKAKGKGFNANPLGEIEEKIRWLCQHIDVATKGREKEKGRRGT